MEILPIQLPVDGAAAALVEVEVLLGGHESVLEPLVLRQAGQQLVEHVVVALLRRMRHNPRLFQQVFRHLGACAEKGSKLFL